MGMTQPDHVTTSGGAATAARPGPRARRESPFGAASDLTRLLPVLVPVTVAGGAAFLAAAWSFGASNPSWGVLAGTFAFLLASVAAEAFPVPIEGVGAGRTSLATVFLVAAAAIYGWAPATILATVTMAVVELGRRRPVSRILYNTAIYALAAAAAGGAAAALADHGLTSLVLGTLLASAAFYLVNITLLATIVSRTSRERLASVLQRYLYWTGVPFGIMASLTVILVVLWDRSPWVAVVLVGPLVGVALHQRWMHGSLTRLRQLDRLKDEFIAVVSHELRTPLASVYGAAMTLQRGRLDPRSHDAMLDVIYRESARLARLVDQVLWASRVETGRAETVIESLDPVRLAREVVDAARAHLRNEFSLDLTSDDSPPPVAGDAEKLKQVLVNLVENAVKYSPDGGRIEVRVEPVDGHVRFTVEDEGIGIPLAEQRMIFEKFHRLDPNLTRGVAGTGLGLYICRELVQQMNGRIWVVSESGKGSVFSFEIPRADLN
jgi:signal transduction histidine kinase